MFRVFSRVAAAAIGLAGMMLACGTAQADSITWQIRSFHRNAVHVKFYSMNRNHVWPTSTTAYAIRDYNLHRMTIACVRGERVCYGAHVVGNVNAYWGVGANPRRACTNCCYICRGAVVSVVHNLNEN